MANLLPFLVMDQAAAARFREANLGATSRLEPRRVEAGPFAGRYVLPRDVIFAEQYAGNRDAFAVLQEIQLDTDVAFPSDTIPE